jgi:hypothetical protein
MDLTDEQREVLEPLIPDRPRREDGRGGPWPAEKNGRVVPLRVFAIRIPRRR